MNKLAVVYWSGTGNTEKMAQAIVDGAKLAGTTADLIDVSSFSADKIGEFDAIAFGCPSMGAEELEDGEFEPVFSECESKLGGKKIALFGSYGWGDGEWMRAWEERCQGGGATLVADSVICNETPDEAGIQECKSLGEIIARA